MSEEGIWHLGEKGMLHLENSCICRTWKIGNHVEASSQDLTKHSFYPRRSRLDREGGGGVNLSARKTAR